MRSNLFAFCILQLCFANIASASIADAIDRTQPKMVKIYGAGGFHNLESYQSGFLISPEGHILTALSYVLDTDFIAVVLDDGRKYDAVLLGADPRLEAAVLKIDAHGLPAFDLAKAQNLSPGDRVLAFSNLFGVAMGTEPVSVQKGTVAAVTHLEGRRGAFETPYRGPIYVLDVTTNNPGAAGGALVARNGELAGMLGKELRNNLNNTWLNYALPIDQIRPSIDDIFAGKRIASQSTEPGPKPRHSLDLASLGVVLIPDVLERTPPYVDRVLPGSSADRAGIRPDDLIVMLNDRLVQNCKALAADLGYVDAAETVRLTLLRGSELVEVSLRASDASRTPKKGTP